MKDTNVYLRSKTMWENTNGAVSIYDEKKKISNNTYILCSKARFIR